MVTRLRILLGSGLLLSLIGASNGQIFSNQEYQRNTASNSLSYDSPVGYPKQAPPTKLTYPTVPPTTPFKPQGYPKETPAVPFTYPTPTTTTRTTPRPTTPRLITTPKHGGYPKETPAVPFTYPTPAPTTRTTTRPTTPRPTTPRPTTTRYTTPHTTTTRPTTPRPTTPRPTTTRYTTPRTTTTRPTTPRPTTPRLLTTPKHEGYPKVTPAVPFTYPTPAPKTTFTQPPTTRPTTPKHQGYPKETPSVSFTYPTHAPKFEGYPKTVPENLLVYQSPFVPNENLFGASSNQQIFKSKFEEDSSIQDHNQLNGAAYRPTTKNTAVLRNDANADDGHYRSEDGSDNSDIRKSVPGEPEVDYPIFNSVPTTSFSCDGRIPGYYADMETRCQTFHVCSTAEPPGMQKTSFLCPNGSVFNQELFTCDWWVNVNCAASEKFFSLNSEIGRLRPVGKQQVASLF